jgi:DNA-binding IclR family transcriptional regulator
VGPTSLKGLSIQVGTRRPLVSASGGVAILVALDEEESRRIIAENMKRIARFGDLRTKSIEKMIRRSQSYGFGVNLGDVVPGINSFGVAIQDENGAPFASLTVSGAAEDFPAAEIPKVMAVLEEERAQIAKKMPV